MEVSMKSKLFLSLSLLTAVFSVKATDLVSVSGLKHQLLKKSTHLFSYVPTAKEAGHLFMGDKVKLLGKACAIPAATFGALLGTAYLADKYQNPAPEQDQATTLEQVEHEGRHARLADNMCANRSYMQIAKDSIVSGYENTKNGITSAYNTVKAKASDLYTNATYENMKNGMVNGFNTAKTFAMKNPYKTASTVAGTAAVVYGAYKLYNSDIFSKSKKEITPVKVATPVAKRIVPIKHHGRVNGYKGA
jgi:hypothetical protein